MHKLTRNTTLERRTTETPRKEAGSAKTPSYRYTRARLQCLINAILLLQLREARISRLLHTVRAPRHETACSNLARNSYQFHCDLLPCPDVDASVDLAKGALPQLLFQAPVLNHAPGEGGRWR